MKKIAILGSTGSIGQSALAVIKNFPREFKVWALTANSNTDILYRQIKLFRPALVCVRDKKAALNLAPKLKRERIKLLRGEEGIEQICGDKEVDQVLLAISGSAALLPLLKAIDNGKAIALANKEALVMAGAIIMERAEKKKIKIIPIDSEQSAIWQCLDGQDKAKLNNIYLTASGGPLRQVKKKEMHDIGINRVLAHPRWKMGKKISVDSANLMNKGLEVLEAMFLFNVTADKIKVIIHPQAIIHSMVEFIDGVILAQLSAADMRIPIQYALAYPERLANGLPVIDFHKLKELNFEKADFKKFPCLQLAYRVADALGTMPAVLNASNEVCVDAFLKRKIKFISIPVIIEKVLNRHKNKLKPALGDILEANAWARNETFRVIDKLK